MMSVEHLSPATPKSLQSKVASSCPRIRCLLPSFPIQIRRWAPSSPTGDKPDVHVHTNPDTHKRDILASVSQDAEMNAAHRIFFDSFAGSCGYATYKERTSSWSTRANIAVGMAKNPQPQFTSQEKDKYVRWNAVRSYLPSIPSMSVKDAMSLVGKYSGRNKLNVAHHRMPLRAVAIHLERYCKLRRSYNRCPQSVLLAYRLCIFWSCP